MKNELKVVLYVLNLAVTSLAAEPACPVCSRYNYEEMLLERVIRNELALENTLKDIKETNTKVVDALRKLQDENDKVNIAIEAMERKQIVMEAALSDSIKTALTNVSESLTHMLTESSQAIKEMEGRVDRIKGNLEMHACNILYIIRQFRVTLLHYFVGQCTFCSAIYPNYCNFVSDICYK
ncbi:hypothetical protein DPMN_141379 [Dreissena polymorpha]|uniref:Uncharacterized protein n=1 Tax=Dreissena polymorpha TaxID=45954 RepID=A0A9D4GCJ6_DREPO|nr:hypothetical protein DPMN_141379 [Dreissena polymorpha]